MTAAASTNTEPNNYRRGGAYSADQGDYIYNTADINLIQPENKPLHTKITAKYTSSITIPNDSLEDTDSAAEYVAKAMGMYGSRLREPIRAAYEPQSGQVEGQQQQQLLKEQESLQQQIEHQPQQDQHKDKEEQNQNNYQYYTYSQKEVAIPQQAYGIQEEQTQDQFQTRNDNEVKQKLEEHLQTQLQQQMQQAQQLVRDSEQHTLKPDRNEGQDLANAAYEKDPVTRSYNIYNDDEHTERYDAAQQSLIDRNYRTKLIYKPVPQQYQENPNESGERIRVSASTEIPKAEIMKQIEKSVIKYMKELEAEGKIIAAPQSQEPKTYFKVITIPGTDEKRIASTTIKPTKYISSSSGNYPDTYKPLPSSHNTVATAQKYRKNSAAKSNYQPENENTYQTPVQEFTELTPNVEFIYKIKTKAPLHAATVKTVSKPYKSFEQFDHSSALKNLEEFDLSHVVTTPDPEDGHHQSAAAAAASNKPNKLYFNSEIYHDINSLPFKQKQRAEAEYRKLKAAVDNQPDYRGGYAATNSQSGFFAEPPPDHEAQHHDVSNSNNPEDDYHFIPPYKHVLKKETLPNKHDDANAAAGYLQQPRHHKYKQQEYDSYNPKFNNNPEGYGYQQTYKTSLSKRHSPPGGKRAKRGGSSSSSI